MGWLRILTTDLLQSVDVLSRSLASSDTICDATIVWVTRVFNREHKDTWRAGYEYLLSQEKVRVIVVDKENRWDWYIANEIPLRIAEILPGEWSYNGFMILHDDLALPAAEGFPEYWRRWLADASSNCMAFGSTIFWDSYENVRVDFSGCDEWHAFAFKWKPGFTFKLESGKYHPEFFPQGAMPAFCPWPLRHYKYVDPVVRKRLAARKITTEEQRPWLADPHPLVMPYDAELTRERLEEAKVMARKCGVCEKGFRL